MSSISTIWNKLTKRHSLGQFSDDLFNIRTIHNYLFSRTSQFWTEMAILSLKNLKKILGKELKIPAFPWIPFKNSVKFYA